MTCVTLSPYYADMPKDVLAKVCLPINAIFMLMFFQTAFMLDTTGPADNALLPFNMWLTQLPISAFILFANIMAVGESGGKKKSK
jgi:hypothetical protein